MISSLRSEVTGLHRKAARADASCMFRVVADPYDGSAFRVLVEPMPDEALDRPGCTLIQRGRRLIQEQDCGVEPDNAKR
jgi:hypothetical protein